MTTKSPRPGTRARALYDTLLAGPHPVRWRDLKTAYDEHPPAYSSIRGTYGNSPAFYSSMNISRLLKRYADRVARGRYAPKKEFLPDPESERMVPRWETATEDQVRCGCGLFRLRPDEKSWRDPMGTTHTPTWCAEKMTVTVAEDIPRGDTLDLVRELVSRSSCSQDLKDLALKAVELHIRAGEQLQHAQRNMDDADQNLTDVLALVRAGLQ